MTLLSLFDGSEDIKESRTERKNCKECHKDKRTLKFCEATGFCRYDEEMWELLKEI